MLDKADNELRPSDGLLQEIQARIVEDLKPVRLLAPPRILLLGSAVIFLSVVAVGALLLGMNGWGAMSFVQRIVVFVTLAAGAISLANSMVREMAPGSRHTLAPGVLLVSILLFLLMVIAAAFRSQREPAFLASGVICLQNGLMYSIPAAFLFWLILRRGAILYPKLAGAIAGGLAGLTGLSVLEVNCPNLNVIHILAWHAGVAVISCLGGALIGTGVEFIQSRKRSAD